MTNENLKSFENKKSLRRLLHANALFNFSRTIPGGVIVLILLSKGIDLPTIALSKAIQLIIAAALTIPAGIFADRYGRKKALIIASTAQLGYFSLLLEPTFYSVLLAEAFNGLGLSFYTGAYEGWLLTFNKSETQSEFRGNIFRSSEFVFLSIAVASVFGAWLDEWAIPLTIGLLFVVILWFSLLPESERHTGWDRYRFLKSSVSFFITQRVGKFIFISSALWLGLMQFIYQFWQPFFQNIGFNTNHKVQFGLIFSVTMFAQYFLFFMFRKIKWMQKNAIRSILICWSLAFFVMLALIHGSSAGALYLCVSMYALYNALMTSSNGFLSVVTAESLEERYHSTGISFVDCSGKILGAIFFFWIIPFISHQNIQYTWLGMGVVFFMLSCITYLIGEKRFFEANTAREIIINNKKIAPNM